MLEEPQLSAALTKFGESGNILTANGKKLEFRRRTLTVWQRNAQQQHEPQCVDRKSQNAVGLQWDEIRSSNIKVLFGLVEYEHR